MILGMADRDRYWLSVTVNTQRWRLRFDALGLPLICFIHAVATGSLRPLGQLSSWATVGTSSGEIHPLLNSTLDELHFPFPIYYNLYVIE